ncbi:hypothetical protein Trydic_g10232 [Trypoxylus dichotomus]
MALRPSHIATDSSQWRPASILLAQSERPSSSVLAGFPRSHLSSLQRSVRPEISPDGPVGPPGGPLRPSRWSVASASPSIAVYVLVVATGPNKLDRDCIYGSTTSFVKTKFERILEFHLFVQSNAVEFHSRETDFPKRQIKIDFTSKTLFVAFSARGTASSRLIDVVCCLPMLARVGTFKKTNFVPDVFTVAILGESLPT